MTDTPEGKPELGDEKIEQAVENKLEEENENSMAVENSEDRDADSTKEPQDPKSDDENIDDAEPEPSTAAAESQEDPIFDQMLLKPLFERRDKSLKELLEAMDEFSPIIPDAVTDYYLAKSGFRTSDPKIKRLLALATQKFIADIASDAYQYSRIRAQTANAAGGAGRGRAGPGSTSGRTVLTMESLSGILGDYGINAKRPDFYR